MATTRIIPMHVNKGKTIAQCLTERTDYAKNPDKTEDGEYISAYACDAKTADSEFLLSKRQYRQLTGREQASDVIAYQIRQSFKPGEVTPEEANQLGYEFAKRFTKGDHAFIVCTHTDKKHMLKRCNGLYDSLYQSYVDQLMTEQEYMTLKRRYKAEAEEAERLIETLTRRQAAEAAHTPENPFLAAFGSFRGADVLTKEMAQALIERVYVDGDSNIEIVFRYRDEYKELCTYLEGRETDA